MADQIVFFSFKEEAAAKCSEFCHKAMEFDPTNPEAFQLMASCLLSEEKMDEARQMLAKSLELWQGKDEELPKVCDHWKGVGLSTWGFTTAV